MSRKKELKPHLDYLEDCLQLLRQKIGESKEYMHDIRWQDVAEVEGREKEFKFQATLMNNYVSWLNEYARLSGIMDAFKEMEGIDDKEVRKGSSRSAYAEMIKQGEFDDE